MICIRFYSDKSGCGNIGESLLRIYRLPPYQRFRMKLDVFRKDIQRPQRLIELFHGATYVLLHGRVFGERSLGGAKRFLGFA